MTEMAMEYEHGSARGYALPMRIIHWLMAIIMFYVIIVGLMMGYKVKVGVHYDYHRALGFVLMVLVILRLLIYRFTKAPSPLPAAMSGAQKALAGAVHFLLYASLLVQPILGWYATNIWGVKKIPFLFGYHLPQLAEKNRELGNQLLAWHGYLGIFIACLVALHIAGALYHHLILKDNVLRRMTSG